MDNISAWEIFKVILQGLVLPILVAGILAIIRSNKKTRTDIESETKLIKSGVQASLRHQLLTLWFRWSEKGWCPYEIKENFENIYKNYHALGANGVMDKYREAFLRLPDHPEERAEYYIGE